jgi:Flp pilus assembly protein TadG
MKMLIANFFRRLHARDRGTVAITFLLSLPVLLTMIAILVQYALLVNARLTVDRALAQAARSAMTSLPTDPAIDPTDGPANVRRAALLVLESLSPDARTATPEAQTVAGSLAGVGAAVPASFVGRYTYADAATNVQIEPVTGGDYARQAAPRARITIRYEFRLTAPVANMILGHNGPVGGIGGRFHTITRSVDVQLSPGREAGGPGVGG